MATALLRTSRRWRLGSLGGLLALAAVAGGIGAATVGPRTGLVSAALLAVAAGLLIWLSTRLPGPLPGDATRAERTRALVTVAAALACVVAAALVWAAAVGAAEAPSQDAAEVVVRDGGSEVLDGMRVAVGVESGSVRLVVTPVDPADGPPSVPHADLTVAVQDRVEVPGWGRLTVVSVDEPDDGAARVLLAYEPEQG
ncbi:MULTISPECIES: hypothetical protein [unclassified Actinotalea]|uniref:hypothetical protein n=1 Tax=unclassified Actinotalea TaxID=2638618 RepID=UPI0015F4FF5D|nr:MULTISPECIES: hypothetical protein [unclassified Actinotalea]